MRYGLAGVKNVGAWRPSRNPGGDPGTGRFETFRDFLERISLNQVNRKVMESLIQAGAFDALEGPARPLHGRAGHRPGEDPEAKRLQAIKQMSMFEAWPSPSRRRLAARDPGPGRSPKSWPGKRKPWGCTSPAIPWTPSGTS